MVTLFQWNKYVNVYTQQMRPCRFYDRNLCIAIDGDKKETKRFNQVSTQVHIYFFFQKSL